jgi:DNA invertase Pin-like site-specific DNA recombinase
MIYGYVRISTPKQNLERQVRNILEAYPSAKIIREVHTGSDYGGRKELQKLLAKVEKDDTIVFDSVSRMSRNASEGFASYEDLYKREINLVFLKEPHINTKVYKETLSKSIELTGNEIADEYIAATNRVLMLLAKKSIQIAYDQAEKELDDLRQRTKEGLFTAKLKGKHIGRKVGAKIETEKSKEVKKNILEYSRDFNGHMSDKALLPILDCTRPTFYKYKKELKQEELKQDNTEQK